MNSNYERYLETVIRNNEKGIKDGYISMRDSLPCFVFRELEAPGNDFVESNEPFIVSYKTLPRILHNVKPNIPRKIEFESSVYLKEGIIDCIFPNSDVSLVFIGDGNSDKRFSYNCHRLFETFGDRFRIFCFIYNDSMIGKNFCNEEVKYGWNRSNHKEAIYYHAKSWNELDVFLDLIEKENKNSRQVLALIDIDGTYFCPRPNHNYKIKEVREKAISSFCASNFDSSFFNGSQEAIEELNNSYNLAANTTFSKSYDDEDLTMLITLGIYSRIIRNDDPLLSCPEPVGFVIPIEFLTYASFLIGNNKKREYELRQLRSLYVNCSDAINSGSPTAFKLFREKEEEILTNSEDGYITLNKRIIEFIINCAKLNSVPISFSDKPNSSVGLYSKSNVAFTCKEKPDALISKSLKIVEP